MRFDSLIRYIGRSGGPSVRRLSHSSETVFESLSLPNFLVAFVMRRNVSSWLFIDLWLFLYYLDNFCTILTIYFSLLICTQELYRRFSLLALRSSSGLGVDYHQVCRKMWFYVFLIIIYILLAQMNYRRIDLWTNHHQRCWRYVMLS